MTKIFAFRFSQPKKMIQSNDPIDMTLTDIIYHRNLILKFVLTSGVGTVWTTRGGTAGCVTGVPVTVGGSGAAAATTGGALPFVPPFRAVWVDPWTWSRFLSVTSSVLRLRKRCCKWTASFEEDASATGRGQLLIRHTHRPRLNN